MAFICAKCLPAGDEFQLHPMRSQGPCEVCHEISNCVDCQHDQVPEPREALAGMQRSSLALASIALRDAQTLQGAAESAQLEALDDTPVILNGQSLYLGLEGQPIGLRTWTTLYGDYDRRCLARDQVGDYEVITAWTGLASFEFMHGMSTNSGIFGSIIKLGDAYSNEIESCSAQAALEAHAVLLAKVRELVSPL